MPDTDDLNERWKYLIERYIANSCSKDELKELLQMVESEPNKDGLGHVLKVYWQQLAQHNTSDLAEIDTRFSILMQQAKETSPVPVINIRTQRTWILQSITAAIIILVFPLIIYFLYKKLPGKETSHALVRNILSNDAAPGQNKAILTLANGARIILDSTHNGAIAKQGNTKIVKTNGVLSYEGSDKTASALYNTVATPRGGQYQLVLSDGSKVWLNASSLLRFPTIL